jgi:hypothetical protein
MILTKTYLDKEATRLSDVDTHWQLVHITDDLQLSQWKSVTKLKTSAVVTPSNEESGWGKLIMRGFSVIDFRWRCYGILLSNIEN